MCSHYILGTGGLENYWRNGTIVVLLSPSKDPRPSTDTALGDPNKPPAVRIERYKLQNALLSQVPPGIVQLSKKLAGIRESADGTTLEFADGTIAGPFDLVIGADGIRSVSPAFGQRSLV